MDECGATGHMIWIPSRAEIPLSFERFERILMWQGFSTIWAAKDLQCPPGHTPYSWEKAAEAAKLCK